MRFVNSTWNSKVILISYPHIWLMSESRLLISLIFLSVTSMSDQYSLNTNNTCWLLSISRESFSHHSTILISWCRSRSEMPLLFIRFSTYFREYNWNSEKSNDIYWGYSESDQSDFHKNFFYFKINPIIIGTL